MMTMRQLTDPAMKVPAATVWLVGDLGVALGKQELFTRQSPQRLKVLREHALIESAVSSNRIEGVEVDQKRVATLVFGSPVLRDRDEQEVAGYRSALDLIHRQAAALGHAGEHPAPSQAHTGRDLGRRGVQATGRADHRTVRGRREPGAVHAGASRRADGGGDCRID
jgi:hypothetical protein